MWNARVGPHLIRSRWFVASMIVLTVAATGIVFLVLEPSPAGKASVARDDAVADTLDVGEYPTAPPAEICGNRSALDGPESPPAGAVVVPAGDNSTMNLGVAGTTYWFASGIHTLGGGRYSHISPGDGSTFTGAPGAVLSGRYRNNYAFEGSASDVTIRHLTIEKFTPPQNEGAVNAGVSDHWTVTRNTIRDIFPGSALYAGSNNVVTDNCITRIGQQIMGTYTTTDTSALTGGAKHVTVVHNEFSRGNMCNWEDDPNFPVRVPEQCSGAGQVRGCGCSGGPKFWAVDGAVVRRNYIHDNLSVGLWADTNNTGLEIAQNYISDNFYDGLVYEISYNARIEDNNFIGNAVGSGVADPGFPHSAVYVSESGSDPRVPGRYSKRLLITGNNFENNWGGVVLWENANRYCGSDANTSSGYCTLVNRSRVDIASCADRTLIRRAPYVDDCRWKTQNVRVTGNTFKFERSTVGPRCTADSLCGYNGLFSLYGTYPPYEGYVVPVAISNNQNNVFADNTYDGPWRFVGLAQGDSLGWGEWSRGWTDETNSGMHFDPQDRGSSYRP